MKAGEVFALGVTPKNDTITIRDHSKLAASELAADTKWLLLLAWCLGWQRAMEALVKQLDSYRTPKSHQAANAPLCSSTKEQSICRVMSERGVTLHFLG